VIAVGACHHVDVYDGGGVGGVDVYVGVVVPVAGVAGSVGGIVGCVIAHDAGVADRDVAVDVGVVYGGVMCTGCGFAISIGVIIVVFGSCWCWCGGCWYVIG